MKIDIGTNEEDAYKAVCAALSITPSPEFIQFRGGNLEICVDQYLEVDLRDLHERMALM